MGIAQWAAVVDTVGGLVHMARRFKQGSSEGLSGANLPTGGPLEARLAGVVVAGLFGGRVVDKPTGTIISGDVGQIAATLVVVATVVFLVMAARDGRKAAPATP